MTTSSFDRAAAWAERLDGARDVVRQRLVTAQLLDHLPPPTKGQVVVDVGCGQGTQLIALARQGYDVVGVDPSEQLLSLADRRLADESAEVRSRVTVRQGSLDTLGDGIPGPIHVLLCHGVLMYLPSLHDSLATLAGHLAPCGVLSVLTRNQASIAMRAGMERRWDDAVAGFDAQHYTNNLGIEGVRADPPDEVIAECEGQGLDVLAWYGVRLFTDHWSGGETADGPEALLQAETEAGKRDPYRRLASLTHVIARARGSGERRTVTHRTVGPSSGEDGR